MTSSEKEAEYLRTEYAKKIAELDVIRTQAKLRGVELDSAETSAGDSGGTSCDDNKLVANAADVLSHIMAKVERQEGDQLIDVGDDLSGFELSPGKITVMGAPPATGKTALAMQVCFNALAADSEMTVVVAAADTCFPTILKRELARVSGVHTNAIRFADFTSDQLVSLREASRKIGVASERMMALQPPFTCEQLAKLGAMPPGILVVDYVQKFSSRAKDARQGANDVMDSLKVLAFLDWSVLALSATSRQNGKGGSNHNSQETSLASFKESGNIEFDADACYLLRDGGPVDELNPNVRLVTLDCVKNRHGSCKSIELTFDRPAMRFAKVEEVDDAEPHSDFTEFSESKGSSRNETEVFF
ncbi:DnaB helicase C-terminal domain-containing protein [Rubripirellula amarantea]|nr:DnaB helicase C-terminal domain-containing protein [Rubripirellula amarantea]